MDGRCSSLLLGTLKDILPKLKISLYLTIDMDVVDPAFAPGLPPEPGGITSGEILNIFLYWSLKEELIAFDLVRYVLHMIFLR